MKNRTVQEEQQQKRTKKSNQPPAATATHLNRSHSQNVRNTYTKQLNDKLFNGNGLSL